MTPPTLDSVSWFAQKPSFPVEEMQCNIKRKELINRTHRCDAFPPPLETPTICDGQFSHLSQVDRVCFTSVRRDGRLILAEKPQPLPPRRYIQSQRCNGRLQLWLYVDDTQQKQHTQQHSIAEISSFQHEQHYPLASSLFNDQKQNNSCAELSLLKHNPHTEKALRRPGRHAQQNPKSNKVSTEKDEHNSIAVQERHNKITTQTLSGDHFEHVSVAISLFPEQGLRSRVANNKGHGQKPSARGFLPQPGQCNSFAEFGRERNSEAETARHHVCEQKQCAHRQQTLTKGSSSSQPFQRPTAEMAREESAEAEVARMSNSDAEIATEIEGKEKAIAEVEMEGRGRPVIAAKAAKKGNPRAQKVKTREEKARQENASAGKGRLMKEQKWRGGGGGGGASLKESLVKCDAFLTEAVKPYEHFFILRSAFLNNSLRPLCMLNL